MKILEFAEDYIKGYNSPKERATITDFVDAWEDHIEENKMEMVINKVEEEVFKLNEPQSTLKIERVDDNDDDQIIEKVNEWIRTLQRYDVSVDLIASHRVHEKASENGRFIEHKDLSSFKQFLQEHPFKLNEPQSRLRIERVDTKEEWVVIDSEDEKKNENGEV